jgi:hypothetical protein
MQVDESAASAKAPAGPAVTSADPSDSPRGVTLDVKVNGSGFSAGADVKFRLAGVDDPKVRTNSTTFVSSSQLVANVTIDADATPSFRDVVVTLAGGKQGIGTESFAVLNVGVMYVPGFTETQSWDVNSSGVATVNGVGTAECIPLGFTWSAETGASKLPLPAGYCRTQANRINDNGVVAGIVSTAAVINGPATQIALYTPDGAGGWTTDVLPKPQPDLTWMSTVTIAGDGSLVSLWRDPALNPTAWYWSTSTGWGRLVGPSGAPESCFPNGLNDHGEIVGSCSSIVLYWASPTSVPVPIQAAGGTPAGVNGINNAGVIIGSYKSGRTNRAARWVPNGAGGWAMQDLGLSETARGINEEGGITVLNTGKAWYVAPEGSVTALDPLSRLGGATIYAAMPGNRSADGVTWIAGYGTASQNGPYRALWWRR